MADREQVRRYATFLRTLACDGLWRHRGKTVLATAAGALAVAAYVQAIVVALWYARAVAEGADVTVAGTAHDPRASVTLLIACAIGTGGLLLVAAASQYAARFLLIRLRMHCAAAYARDVMAQCAGAPRSIAHWPEPLALSDVMQIARGDAMYAGRCVQMLAQAITPLIVVLGAFVVLMRLNLPLTLGLLALGIVGGFGVVVVNKRGVAHSRGVDATKRASAAEYRTAVVAIRNGEDPGSPDDWSATQDWHRHYEGRIRSVFNGEFAGGLILAVALGVTTAGLGLMVIRGGARFELVATYIVALQFALTKLRDVIRSATSLNRYYPQVRRVQRFLETPPAFDGDAPLQWKLRSRTETPWPSATSVVVPRGARVIVLTPITVDRLAIPWVTRLLGGRREPDATARAARATIDRDADGVDWWFGALSEAPADVVAFDVRSVDADLDSGEASGVIDAVVLLDEDGVVAAGAADWAAAHANDIRQWAASLETGDDGASDDEDDPELA